MLIDNELLKQKIEHREEIHELQNRLLEKENHSEAMIPSSVEDKSVVKKSSGIFGRKKKHSDTERQT